MTKGRRLYYTMGQVSEMFDLAPSTIRFWEQRFSILRPRKNAKGNRLFTPDDVENLKLIYHLTKEKKMTLAGAEKFLMQRRVAAKGEMSMVEILQKIRTTLVEIRQEIESSEQPSEQQFVIHSEQVEIEATNHSAGLDDELMGVGGDESASVDASMANEAEKPRYIELTLF